MVNRKKIITVDFNCHFKKIGFIVVLISLLLTSLVGQSQTYQEAKDLAYNGEREKAREFCRTLLAREFDSDVAVLMARTFAWDGQYDSTRVLISEVLKRYPSHWDALDAISDVQYWDEKYDDAIRYCDIALAKVANDEHFMLKKAKILNSAGRYDQAADLLEALLKISPANAEARNKLEIIRLDQLKNRIRISYTYDFFAKNSSKDPWHLVAVQYGRKTSMGAVIARINWAERFGTHGVQYEADAYPHISENNYAYVNIGYSNLSVFPKFRAGAELYHSFPKAFEGSLGMRSLYFSGSDVYMFTGTVGKYTGNYWFSLRTYVTPSSTGTSLSGSIQARRYFSDPENYIGMKIGYGISPDDRTQGDGTSTYLTMHSQSISVDYNHIFNRIWTSKVGFALSNDEFPNIGYVRNYTFDIGIGRFF